MEIDIISYTAEQFAELTAEQLKEVRSAQLKKDKLEKALAARLLEEKQRMIENGTYLSSAWPLLKAKLQQDYNAEVAILRDGLLFYLHYSSKPEEETGAPYPLDYSLSETERYKAVKAYYETTYSDGTERFNAFKQDAVARKYLGELYATLYDVFLESA